MKLFGKRLARHGDSSGRFGVLELPKASQHLVDIAPTFPLLAQIKYRTAQKGRKCVLFIAPHHSAHICTFDETVAIMWERRNGGGESLSWSQGASRGRESTHSSPA